MAGWSGNKLTCPFTKIAANGRGDLQLAWGVSSTGMTQANLFANGKINKWAKYKPFQHSTVFTDRYGDTNSQRLAGLKSANYGFGSGFVSGTTVFTTKSDLHSGFTNTWTYYRPVQGTHPLRALDAEGYVGEGGWSLTKYTDAAGNVILSGPFGCTLQCKETFGQGMLMYAGILPADAGSDGGLLTIDDFAGLGSGFYDFTQWYFGVALISKSSASNDRFYVYNTKLTQPINIAISIPASGNNSAQIPAGNYYIVPILCASNSANTWTATMPGTVVTLDGWYLEGTMSATQTGFSWGISGSPYISGGNLMVDIMITNTTGLAVTINRMFTYSMADGTYESDTYTALVDACRYWVNNKAEATNGAGVKVNNQVVAAYKQLATGLIIPAGYNNTLHYAVTTGTKDARGEDYDQDTDVRLCLQYDSTNYVCNNIY